MDHVPLDPADGSGSDQPDRRWSAAAGHIDPADPHLLERLGIVVPDDARALDAERFAMFGQPAGSWTRRLRRAAARPLRQLTSPMVITLFAATIVTAVAVASSLVSLLAPRGVLQRSTTSVPVASAPVATPGAIGGLLPEAGVRIDDTVGTSARELRPAVLFHPPIGISPTACDRCTEQLTTLWHQAVEYGLGVYIVVPPGEVAAAAALSNAATQGAAHVVADSSGALTAAYAHPRTTQIVLVHSDGVVGRVLTDPAADGRFEQVLSPLRSPGAPPSVAGATSAQSP